MDQQDAAGRTAWTSHSRSADYVGPGVWSFFPQKALNTGWAQQTSHLQTNPVARSLVGEPTVSTAHFGTAFTPGEAGPLGLQQQAEAIALLSNLGEDLSQMDRLSIPLGLQAPPQKVSGPSWHPPQTPSQKVLGALGYGMLLSFGGVGATW